jgi:hypothetical protein
VPCLQKRRYGIGKAESFMLAFRRKSKSIFEKSRKSNQLLPKKASGNLD